MKTLISAFCSCVVLAQTVSFAGQDRPETPREPSGQRPKVPKAFQGENYYIQSVPSGRYLDADMATIGKDGTRVQLYGKEAAGIKNRTWIIRPASNDTYFIINAESGRYLDAERETIDSDGTKVQLYGYDGAGMLNRQWRIAPAGADAYFIINAQSGRLLDADSRGISHDGTLVQLYGLSGAGVPNRQWRLHTGPKRARLHP